jgi:hypothetical protein
MANPFYLETAAKLAIAERQFPPTCLDDIKLAFVDVPDAEVAAKLPKWFEAHKDYAPTSQPVNEALEAEAFGAGNVTKQGTLFKEYGAKFFAERKAAYAAGAKDRNCATIDKAKAIVDAEASNSPFNPALKMSDAARVDAIAKFIRTYGAAKSARHAARFSVDLAGRALRKRA